MHVTKVVDLFSKIPEQLSLHFSDFSTIFKRIYKFTRKIRKHKNTDCKGTPGIFTKPPRNLKLFASRSLAGVGDRGGGGGPFPGEEKARRRRGWRPGVRAHRALPVGGCCGRRGWPEQGRRRRTGSGGGGCSGRLRSCGPGRR